MNFDNLDKTAQRFLHAISNANQKKPGEPQSAKESQSWRDLQADIDSKKSKPESLRHHFCSVCGYICSNKHGVVTHATGPRHKASHSTFDQHNDAIFLQNVSNYYHHIKDMNCTVLDKTAKRFLHIVENANQTKPGAPLSVEETQAWLDLQAAIDSKKNKKESMRHHFCSVCGLVYTQKHDVVRHATGPQHKATHSTFDKHNDAIFLQSVSNYHGHIKGMNFNDLDKTAQDFLKNVENACQNNVITSKPVQKTLIGKRERYFKSYIKSEMCRPDHSKRKQKRPRQAPPHVPCVSRCAN
jgi:hypothetical protein